MIKINKTEFQQGTYYLKDYLANKGQQNDRVAFFVGSDVFISQSGDLLYIVDYNDGGRTKYFKQESTAVMKLYKAFLELYINDVGVHKYINGNSAVYGDFEKTNFLYGPIEFNFNELRNLYNNIVKAKNRSSSKLQPSLTNN